MLSNMGKTEIESDLLDAGEDGGYSGVGFAEIPLNICDAGCILV